MDRSCILLATSHNSLVGQSRKGYIAELEKSQCFVDPFSGGLPIQTDGSSANRRVTEKELSRE